MERSRSDVYQRTIDEQNQKIEKYQTKLRGDLFMLYRSFQFIDCYFVWYIIYIMYCILSAFLLYGMPNDVQYSYTTTSNFNTGCM